MLLILTYGESYLRAIGLTDLPNGNIGSLPVASCSARRLHQLDRWPLFLQTGKQANGWCLQAHELSLHTVAVFR